MGMLGLLVGRGRRSRVRGFVRCMRGCKLSGGRACMLRILYRQ